MKYLAFVYLLVSTFAVAAEERIREFHSDILITQDGWVEVSETITVQAEGHRIKRGIYRDFPTTYYDKLGNRYEIEFKLLSVLRNGKPEDSHIQNIRDGRRIYFGNSKQFISKGKHSYVFRYKVSRMLGFFEHHDELYWNVTGFDWAFPIDQASASVKFSFDIVGDLSYEAYTGYFGATERDYTSTIEGNYRINFTADNPLTANNGLTIVVGWPKGYISQPTQLQRYAWLLRDNVRLLTAITGLLILVIYYTTAWRRFGKDPDEDVIVTRYQPPKPYSPASLRYIRQMYYDDKVMTAAVLNLAVKGYLRIKVKGKATEDSWNRKLVEKHTLVKAQPPDRAAELAPGEEKLLYKLFRDGDKIELDNANHQLLDIAKRAHRQSLKKDYDKHYFRTNRAFIIPAIVIVLVTSILALSLGSASSLLVMVPILAMFATVNFFTIVMKRPTLRGRVVLNEMLGFKDYLEVAERDRLDQLDVPEKTQQLFETYLPYALALDVDQQWADKFSDVFSALTEKDNVSYQPSWYNGEWNTSHFSSTTNRLSRGLNQAIGSSVTPPGSSSGSSGGFSGGGGGGGGGGGW